VVVIIGGQAEIGCQQPLFKLQCHTALTCNRLYKTVVIMWLM